MPAVIQGLSAPALAMGFAAVAMVVTLAGCRAGPCGSVVSDAPRGATGTLAYSTGKGGAPLLLGVELEDVGSSTLSLRSALRGARAERPIAIELSGLRAGEAFPLPGAAKAEACWSLQEGEAPTCLPLEGSIDVRVLSQDCYRHESGVGVCAENIDATLHATATKDGVTMKLDLEITSAQRWTDPDCSR